MQNPLPLTKRRAIFCGLLAGIVAGLAMTLVMLLLAWKFRIATPLVLLGDRLSVFLSPRPFFWIMGRVGGYNHLKQLGVASSALGQLAVGAIGGAAYGAVRWRVARMSYRATAAVFVALPLLVCIALLWPVLGTHYAGLPVEAAGMVTL